MIVWTRARQLLSLYVPAHIQDPFGLIKRMLLSGSRAAWFTLWTAGVAVLLLPLDLLLAPWERRRARQGAAPGSTTWPCLFICGPARSGTTVVYQYLASQLDVAYCENFTYLFPRSTLLSSRLIQSVLGAPRPPKSLDNYYGKTTGLRAPSEANHLWNQWVRPDSSGFRTRLSTNDADRLAAFVRAFSRQSGKPMLAKNNNLNVFADVVAEALPEAWFICLRREPRFLAQSLIRASQDIHGNPEHGYGVRNDDSPKTANHVQDVCQQVKYLNDVAEHMRNRIGDERFIMLDYEKFCEDPSTFVEWLTAAIPGLAARPREAVTSPSPLAHHNVVGDPDQMRAIEHCLSQA